MKKIELLAPVGSMNKLNTAFHFGADAVYLGGANFGLRAYATNFDVDGIKLAVDTANALNKKVYVTVNIFAKNSDFEPLRDYLLYLQQIGVHAIIVSDSGIVNFARRIIPNMEIHLSTQANTTNKYAVEFWRDIGVKRVVLARELSLADISEIHEYLGDSVELESFVHGAMCISYSGRCLLSNYLTNRDSNRGECVQACRWEYSITEKNRPNNPLTLVEDDRGSYILNSKDLCTLPFLDKIIESGITSLKIEGRMKSEYYVGSVVNYYRRGLNQILKNEPIDLAILEDLNKISHRDYTDGFYLGKDAGVCYNTSLPENAYDFVAEVKGYDDEKGLLLVEQRNRFFAGDSLEILSNAENYKHLIKADEIFDEKGNRVEDCKFVQQLLYIKTPIKLKKYDILRGNSKS